MDSEGNELEKKFASSPEALLLCDPGGRIMDVSPPACVLTGYPREDLLDRPLDELTEPAMGYLFPELGRIATVDLEAGIRCKDGSTKPFHLKFRPFRLGDRTHSMIRVSRHRRASDQLPEDPDFVRALLRSCGTYILSVSAQGRIVFANSRFEELAGLPLSQLRGREAWDLLFDPVQRAELRRVFDGPASDPEITMQWPGVGGTVKTIVWSRAPLDASMHRPSYQILIGRELLPSGEIHTQTVGLRSSMGGHGACSPEEHVTRLNSDLESLRLEHDSLMYSLAHDLRAPLRAMSGFSDALIDEYSLRPLDEAGRQYAREISQSAHRMDALIDGLLQYSRLCRMPIRPGTVALDNLLTDVIRSFDHEIQARKASIMLEAKPGEIVTDRTILILLVSHLLSNALKFVAPHVEARVSIKVESLKHNRGVRLSVRDNGIGISADYHRVIFGMFQRLNRAESYLGTGMGLAIVGKCAERLKASLGLNSQPAQGSAFWVDLPPIL